MYTKLWTHTLFSAALMRARHSLYGGRGVRYYSHERDIPPPFHWHIPEDAGGKWTCIHSDDVFVRQWEGGGVMQTNWLLAAVALFPDAHWLRSGMLGSGLGCSSLQLHSTFQALFHYVMTFQDGMEVECGRANAP